MSDVQIKRMEVTPDIDAPRAYGKPPFAYEVVVTLTVQAESHAGAARIVQDRLMRPDDAIT